MSTTIYKIMTEKELKTFQNSGVFEGSHLDQQDGYIHCSASIEQTLKIISKFFQGQKNLKRVEINPDGLDVRFEISPRSGITYPHVYQYIPLDKVTHIEDLS